MRLLSPAKVNLFLKIQGKREDGFHEIETLMCPITCCDEIDLEATANGKIDLTIEGADLPTGPENLAYQAASRLRERAGISDGVRIHIQKRIPLGGGLAGGSSNAAMVLRGCNELWSGGLSRKILHELAAGLGSDVNLFLEEGACLCRGRGEKVEPVAWKGDVEILLLNPGFPVSTPWAFKTYAQLAPKLKSGEPGRWETSYLNQQGEEIPFLLRNDLEAAVFSKYLWMAEAKGWLLKQQESLDALMSGSGATLFALTPDADAAISLKRKIMKYFGPESRVLRVRPV